MSFMLSWREEDPNILGYNSPELSLGIRLENVKVEEE